MLLGGSSRWRLRNTVDAFTPTLGFATQVVSVTVLLFFVLIGFVFWITSLHDRPDYRVRAGVPHHPGEPQFGAATSPEHGQTGAS